MNLKRELLARSIDPGAPVIIDGKTSVTLRDILETPNTRNELGAGDVVAVIGDFDARTISTLLDLVERGVTIMPLTPDDRSRHDYFFKAGCANAVIEGTKFERLNTGCAKHPLLENLKERGHGGLILFTSGTTGQPKAILHDMQSFLARFSTPRKAFVTLNFLLFDHIGGLNTLFHTLYNGGLVVRPANRSVDAIRDSLAMHRIELLPTTPTFLRMLALSGNLSEKAFPALKLITYGTERMDQSTLDALACALPNVDFRQTYGMSELGILRVRTRSRDQLWVQVGGEGVESRIMDNELHLRCENRMLGYLNAPTPFDDDGWYPTRDLVETDGEWLRFVGRRDTIINVGGLKVYPSEVEHAALSFPGIRLAKASGHPNPLTGMHVELLCEADENIDRHEFRLFLSRNLPDHALPRRISFGTVSINHRCKQL